MRKIYEICHIFRCVNFKHSPVVVARHFQYRFEVFFTGILMSSDLLGEIKYYVIRVEFRFRGSSYIHYFLWILNPVKLSK